MIKVNLSRVSNNFKNSIKHLREKVENIDKMINEKTGEGSAYLGWTTFANTLTAPELKKICKTAQRIQENCDVLVVVGIGGSYLGAKAAIEAVDTCLGRVVDKVLELDGTVFITADHGNAETMIDAETGNPFTAHTTDPVPFVWVSNQTEGKSLKDGKLADIAPTMLTVMGLDVPAEMTGESLIVNK